MKLIRFTKVYAQRSSNGIIRGEIIMNQNDFYTAGQLADLFAIPKQTMEYYDKMGVLKPAYVAKNGYRYYATQQYLTLEIILFLRKMDIPVADIKAFIENKSRKEVLNLLAKKEEECRQELVKTKQILASLANYRNTLEESKALPLNQVLLANETGCRMYLTPIPEEKRGGLSTISVRAQHVREAFSRCYCKERPTGWVISKDDFFHSRFNHSSAVATLSGPPDSPLPCNYVRPAGLYASVHIKGAYFHHAADALALLTEFMERNHLAPDGDVFLFPIVNYWVTDDPESYINTLSVKVTAK